MYRNYMEAATSMSAARHTMIEAGKQLGINNPLDVNKIREIAFIQTLHKLGVDIMHETGVHGADAKISGDNHVEIKTTAIRPDRRIRSSDSVAVFGQQYMEENRTNALKYDTYVFGVADDINITPVPLIVLFHSKDVVLKLKEFISRAQNNYLDMVERVRAETGQAPRYDGVKIPLLQVLNSVDWKPDLFVINGKIYDEPKKHVIYRKSILLEKY